MKTQQNVNALEEETGGHRDTFHTKQVSQVKTKMFTLYILVNGINFRFSLL